MYKLLLFLVLSTFTSCGEALNTRRRIVWNDYSRNSLLICAPDIHLSALFKQSADLKGQVDKLITIYPNIFPILDLADDNSHMGPLNPLKINDQVLQTQINSLQTELDAIKKLEINSIAQSKFFNLQEKQKKFYQRLVRYNNLLCQKSIFQKKEALDVRPYFILENQLFEVCRGDFYCLSNNISHPAGNLIQKFFLSLCTWSYSSHFCQTLLDNQELLVARLPELIAEYKKTKVSFFYNTDEEGPKFNCDIEDKNSTMKIEIYSSEITLSENDLQKIAQFWNNEDRFKINFYFTPIKKEHAIEIKLSKAGVSFVESNHPQIVYLSDLILKNRDEMLSTLAHEFGHSLGLRDCYLEFLDGNLTSVYYQLDSFNLMCSINGLAKISRDSLVSIFKNRCM